MLSTVVISSPISFISLSTLMDTEISERDLEISKWGTLIGFLGVEPLVDDLVARLLDGFNLVFGGRYQFVRAHGHV